MAEMTLEQAVELADRLKAQGKPAEAEHLYREILAAAPDQVNVLNRLGILLGELGRLQEARPTFQQAVDISPGFAGAWANLSLACEKLEEFDAAIVARRKAIELDGNCAEYWHRLGTCFGKKRDFGAAIESLRKSVQLDATVGSAHHDLVFALCRDDQLDAAEEAAFKRIAAAHKVDGEMIRLVADGRKAAGQFDRATEAWRKAVDKDPTCPEARGQLAMCLITLGDYKNGWRMYESRWDCDTFDDNSRRDPSRQWGRQPVGSPDVSGKTIMLYTEQGMGDTIQFVRYASLFERRGARVIVQCPWPVKSLLERATGVRLVYGTLEQLPKYDWHIPMMSLPLAFETTLETIPAEIPYLKVDPGRRKQWAARVKSSTPAGARLRVGLAWAGNPKHKNDANRSIDPEFLSPLADVGGVVFFSLQKANENEKAAVAPVRPRLVDFAASLHDFAETAALIDHLDLVICADTAISHLAGALGKPVWTLLPYVPDFRWGLEGEQTPWYPTMRLFRQTKPADWQGVIDLVVEALRKRVSEVSLLANDPNPPVP